ncbi:Fic family protein [Kitasatospora mediocidica]|uniref:Fic family protein n=1 Tax=Kitasatospora mediocidica TaxID=58352 RepID=UPI0012F8FB77|nr:Fic family protein [Kitasatospora mediocidica]
MPVVPPLDARAIPDAAHREALAALADLTGAAARLGDPDLFHRPRLRRLLHRRHLAGTDPEQLAEQLATAAESRVAAGLLAVHSVRAELAEQPGRRPCFTPDALADLHAALVAGDPNIPSPGGFRRSKARVTWPDGRVVIVPVAPGAELRTHVERWNAWGTATVSAPLDAAALAMAQLLTIHPFPDANGRMARLLGQCDLVAAGLLPGLLLDLDGWVPAHRIEHDEALVAASDGELSRWGEVFARAVTETARHRTATVRHYGALLDEAIGRAAGDPAAAAVLAQLAATPAVSAGWLRERIPYDPHPPLARLERSGVLAAHPRLPGALVHPQLLAVLDTPFGESPDSRS